MTGEPADLLERVRRHVTARGLFPVPGTAVVAVSGGPDSVALLDLLIAVGPAHGLDLAVGHVDHGIHLGSATVADRVADLAAWYGVPYHLERLALGADATETAARGARYRALRHLQRALGARYLLTAHHAEDQVETVLLRLLRGSGVAGLAGVPEQGPRGLVRPLLPFSKRELREWLEARGRELGRPFAVFDDPANSALRHDRSWIREEVLPLLRARYGVALDQRLLDVSRHAARDRAAWAALLGTLPELECVLEDGVAEVARTPLSRYDKLLCEGLLRALAREAGCVLGPRRAARLARFVCTAESGRRMELGAGWEAQLAFDRLRLVGPHTAAPAPEPVALDGAAGRTSWSASEIAWRPARAGTAARASFTTWVTTGPGLIRPPAAGDRMLPLGGVGRRKVARLLMEARVPRSERHAYPLLVRGGDVLWIPGICRAEADVPPAGVTALEVEVQWRSRQPA